MELQRLWLKLACYLIGWNYSVLEKCSEVSKRDAKRYCSAILLISILWFFIGYAFAERYIGLELLGCIISALIAVLFIIQVERQVIMSDKSRGMAWFRFGFAGVMALIGAVLIDQYIFKHDIDSKKEDARKARIDSAINKFDIEFSSRQDRLQKELLALDVESRRQADVFNNEIYGKGKSSLLRGYGTIAKAQEHRINDLTKQKAVISRQLSDLFQAKLKNKEKTINKIRNEPGGFLEEFMIVIGLIGTNMFTLFLYVILFTFFLLIELLVVLTKTLTKNQNDYERVIEFQREVRLRQLMTLEEEASKSIGRDNQIQNSKNLIGKVV